MISAIILAAGESTRMGFLKQLADIKGRPMLENVVKNVCSSKVDEVIVVLGYMAEEIAKSLPKDEVRVVVNKNYRQGMSTSLKVGLNAVNKKAKAVIFVLADQPLLKTWIINKIVEEYKKVNASIVVPTYKGKKGNPVLFDISLKGELLKIQGDVGGRFVARNHENEIHMLEIDSPLILMDVDTKKDLDMLKERYWD